MSMGDIMLQCPHESTRKSHRVSTAHQFILRKLIEHFAAMAELGETRVN